MIIAILHVSPILPAVWPIRRSIVDGIKKVRILGVKRIIKAKIVRIHGFSAHADRNELLDWLKELEASPKGVFIVHGETKSAKSFSNFVKEQTGWKVSVPEYQDEIILD